MRISTPKAILKIVTCILFTLTAGNINAQSAADQALKTLPQTVKDNGENHVVTRSNAVSNSAMNKVDSAGNKALKGFSGLFKKKNKKKAAGDSTAIQPTDTITAPKRSTYNWRILSHDSRLHVATSAIQKLNFSLNAFIKINQV